jgi:hypothetical protein
VNVTGTPGGAAGSLARCIDAAVLPARFGVPAGGAGRPGGGRWPDGYGRRVMASDCHATSRWTDRAVASGTTSGSGDGCIAGREPTLGSVLTAVASCPAGTGAAAGVPGRAPATGVGGGIAGRAVPMTARGNGDTPARHTPVDGTSVRGRWSTADRWTGRPVNGTSVTDTSVGGR